MIRNDASTAATLKLTRVYLPWQAGAEERWLEAMALQGWQFESYGLLSYTFRPAEPRVYAYRLDFTDSQRQTAPEYLALLEDAGWEQVAEYSGWHYLRMPAERYSTDIYSDNESRVAMLLRLRQRLAAALLPVTIGLLPVTLSAETVSERFGTVAGVLLLVFVALCFVVGGMLGASVVLLSREIARLQRGIRA